MPISAAAAGAWADSNAATQTVTLPTHATGDMLILVAAAKAANPVLLNPTITTPASGWTRLYTATDGSVAAGAGTGSVRQLAFWRIAASSAETNPVITWATTSAPGIAVPLVFSKAAGETWVITNATPIAITAVTSISVTPSAIVLAVDNWGIAVFTTADDSALTVPTWTSTGATLSAATVFPTTPIATATSNDMAGTAVYRVVTAGSSSTGLTLTATQAAAETGMAGFIRLSVTGGATPVTGTGAGTGTAATSGGTAAETISGTGASTGTGATASGTGSVGSAGATGTGAGTQTTQSASGTGAETITGTGAGTPPPASSAGSGTSLLAATGTGAGTQAVQTAAGSGSSLLAATGTGAGVQAAASASGSGDVAALGDITGSGAGVQVPQSADGTGTVEGGVEVPPTMEGSTIFAPKLRVIAGSGGGVQARQSAKGRGRVNDDDLVVMAA